MPYSIKKDGEQWCVMKGTEQKKCYDSRARALAYQRALTAAESKGLAEPAAPPDIADDLKAAGLASGAKAMKLRQDDVQFAFVSPQLSGGQICQGCRWFEPGYYDSYDEYLVPDRCHLVEDWPKAITPLSWCDRYEVYTPEVYEPQPRPVYIVPTPTDAEEKAMSRDPTILRKGVNALLKLFGANEQAEHGFKVNTDGTWEGWWSNNRKDREDEIFAYAAQEDYVKAVKAGEWPLPELDYWHIPGTEHGVATWVGQAGDFMLAKGVFYDNDLGRGFRAFYQTRKAWQMSHEFVYPPELKLKGVYYLYRTKKVSVLPGWAAANPYTAFDVSGEKHMQVTDAQYADIVAAVGEEKAKTIRERANGWSKQLDDAGIASKADQQAALTVEDAEARKGVTEMAGALAEMGTSMKALKDEVNTKVNGLSETVTKQGEAIEALDGFIREQFALAPRASKSKLTEVDETNPALKFLSEKNRNAGKKSIVEQVLSGETPGVHAPVSEDGK